MWRVLTCLLPLLVLMSGVMAEAPPRQGTDEYWRLCARVHEDPTAFHREILGQQLWGDDESGIVRPLSLMLSGERRIMMPSGNSTGKTHFLGGLGLMALSVPHVFHPDLSSGGGVQVITMSRARDQLNSGLWKEIRTQYAGARVKLGGRMTEKEGWKIAPNRFAMKLSPGEGKSGAETISGKHAELQVVIVDEGNTVPAHHWSAINSLLTSEHCYLIVAFNPVVPSGYVYSMAKRRDLWSVCPISGLDHPNVVLGEEVIPGAVTRRWIEELLVECDVGHKLGSLPWEEVDRRIRSGEYKHAEISSRVLGRFPRGQGDTFVDLSSLEEASLAGSQLGVKDRKRIGVDVAWLGPDKNVLVVLDETRTVIHRETWSGQKTPETAGRIKLAMERWHVQPPDTKVDNGSYGAAVVDMLEAQGLYVERVDFGGGVRGDWPGLIPSTMRLKNRKAELWMIAAFLLQKKLACVPEQYGALWEDLTAPKKQYTERGEIKVESKESLRSRYGHSPDDGDAFVIALSNVGRDLGFGVY